MTRRIDAVGVVLPARDESEHIQACLSAVLDALATLPAGIDRAVCVVLDRCIDDTAARTRALGHGGTVGSVVNDAPAAVGALRELGTRHVLARLAPHPPERIWLLHTDADTTVPAGWVTAHLDHAAGGTHAVAGLAALDHPARLTGRVRRTYERLVAAGTRADGHDHVYGAHLGVRADAQLAVGGFPRTGPGEDHGLWERLRAGGFRLATPTTPVVSTSARTRGRARGGLADLLHTLH